MEFDKVKELVQFMKSEGVMRFKVDGVEVEFNPLISSIQAPAKYIDSEQEKTENLKATLKNALQQQNEDLLWST